MPELSEHRDALIRFLHNQGDGGIWEHFDRTNAETVADALLASDALARIVADARAEALQEAADALNVDGVAFRPGWGSGNEGDQGALDVLGKSIAWLRTRADREGATESEPR